MTAREVRRIERGAAHLAQVALAARTLAPRVTVVEEWGTRLARTLSHGGRLLAAGNGGSAAEAQHLTAEILGRYREDRPPFSAIALHADTSAVTAISNDYGYEQVFARQVIAHARPADVLVLMSTSGRSPNLLSAAQAARAKGCRSWALTGSAPNPLAATADEVVTVPGTAPVVQALHLVLVHVLCEAFDDEIARIVARTPSIRPRGASAVHATATGARR